MAKIRKNKIFQLRLVDGNVVGQAKELMVTNYEKKILLSKDNYCEEKDLKKYFDLEEIKPKPKPKPKLDHAKEQPK